MSAQGQITDFLRTLSSGEEFVPMTPNQIALQTGISREQVNKTLYNLASHDRVELERGKNGRDIVGLKVIDLEPRQRGGARTPRRERVRYAEPVPIESAAPRRRSSIGTPALDEYARAKHRFDQLRADLGDLVDATFRENPYAEEGLRLRDRLALIEQQLIDVRSERDEFQREAAALRARKRADLAEAAEKDGTMVQHGD